MIRLRAALLVVGDFLLAWGALALAVHIRRTIELPFTRSLLPARKLLLDLPTVALFGGAFLIALGLAGFYRQRIMLRFRPIVLVALLIQLAIVAIGGEFLEHPLPRTILLAVPLIEAIAFPLWRALQRRLWPVRPRETILVGEPKEIDAAIAVLDGAREKRVRVAGRVSALDDPQTRNALCDAEEVICVWSDSVPRGRLELLRIRGPRGYLLLASSADALLTSSALGWMGDEPLIEVRIRCGFGVQAFLKRAMDVVVASALIVLSSPLWLLIALAIFLDDRKPVLLRQSRLGLGGVPFAMWKFRTMHDERVTRAGNLLRRYRLDELPQLVNVLTGDMSLVGPRPEQPSLAERIMLDVPDFDLRCLVRPGIAGLAQIMAEYDSRPAVKLRYDLTYMCSWSLWLDVRLMFLSVAAALSGSGI